MFNFFLFLSWCLIAFLVVRYRVHINIEVTNSWFQIKWATKRQ